MKGAQEGLPFLSSSFDDCWKAQHSPWEPFPKLGHNEEGEREHMTAFTESIQ